MDCARVANANPRIHRETVSRAQEINMRKILLLLYKKGFKLLSGYKYELGKFYPIKVIYNLMNFLLKSNFAEIQGHKMFLDQMDSLHLSTNEIYEPLETELVKNEIKRGDIVLDIGANIGYYTLIYAKLVGEEGKVFAFEPDPNNFALLKKNVEINGYKNVILVQKAVSNKNEKIKLYLSKGNLGDHRIYNSYNGRKSIEIESIILDDYFINDKKIDFIKMDIQGAEGGALQGLSNLIKKNKNLKIVTEFWPIGLKRFGIEPIEYLKTLIKHGFSLYQINERKKKIELVTNISKLLTIYSPENEEQTDLLCVKESNTRTYMA